MPDTEISILDRCSGRQLKELLSLVSNEPKEPQNWLLEIGDLEKLEYLLREMCAGTTHSAVELLQSICSADTALDTLIETKDVAKHLASVTAAPAQKAAAALLYHLSVASALGRYARSISSKDPGERLPLYKELAAELSDEKLAAIFEKAVAICSLRSSD
jgi:hypothetical protein